MTNDELKERLYDFLKSRGDAGAMVDDLMEQPEIGSVGRQAIQEALKVLSKENRIASLDPIYGYRHL